MAAEKTAIGNIVVERKWEELPQHGITVIHLPEEVAAVNCGGWLFPDKTNQTLDEIAKTYTVVESPQVGDLVLYYGTFEIEGQPKRKCIHIGRIIEENGLTESKFGTPGSVVQHNYVLVPFFYGDEIKFAREPQPPVGETRHVGI